MSGRFPSDVIAAAQSSGRRHSLFPSVILAQWALESAYGARMSGKNNPFGIKATVGQAGTAVLTHEQDAQGASRQIRAVFADYRSMDDAFEAHGRLLSISRYLPVRQARTPKDAAIELKACGYATDVAYPGKLISIMEGNALYQYDPGGINAAVIPPVAAPAHVLPRPAPTKLSKAKAGAVVAAGGAVVVAGAANASGSTLWPWVLVLVAVAAFAAFLVLHFRKAS